MSQANYIYSRATDGVLYQLFPTESGEKYAEAHASSQGVADKNSDFIRIGIGQKGLGTPQTSDWLQLPASGVGTLKTTGSFADWPDAGYCQITTADGEHREVVYYNRRTVNTLTVWSTGRGQLYSEISAGEKDDVLSLYYPISYIARSILLFDTAWLMGRQISSVKLGFYGKADHSENDFSIIAQKAGGALPHEPISRSDYSLDYFSGNYGSFITANFGATTTGLSNVAHLPSSGGGIIETSGSFASWPASGFCQIKYDINHNPVREIVYYASRTNTRLFVSEEGRGLLGTYPQSGSEYDAIDSLLIMDLDVDIINSGGLTAIGLRSSRDIAGQQPNGNELVEIYSGNSGFMPCLFIEYQADKNVELLRGCVISSEGDNKGKVKWLTSTCLCGSYPHACIEADGRVAITIYDRAPSDTYYACLEQPNGYFQVLVPNKGKCTEAYQTKICREIRDEDGDEHDGCSEGEEMNIWGSIPVKVNLRISGVVNDPDLPFLPNINKSWELLGLSCEDWDLEYWASYEVDGGILTLRWFTQCEHWGLTGVSVVWTYHGTEYLLFCNMGEDTGACEKSDIGNMTELGCEPGHDCWDYGIICAGKNGSAGISW